MTVVDLLANQSLIPCSLLQHYLLIPVQPTPLTYGTDVGTGSVAMDTCSS